MDKRIALSDSLNMRYLILRRKVISRNPKAQAASQEERRTVGYICHWSKGSRRRFIARRILLLNEACISAPVLLLWGGGLGARGVIMVYKTFCFLSSKMGLWVSRIWFLLIYFKPMYFPAIIIQLKSLMLLRRGKLLPLKSFAGKKEHITPRVVP